MTKHEQPRRSVKAIKNSANNKAARRVKQALEQAGLRKADFLAVQQATRLSSRRTFTKPKPFVWDPNKGA